MTTPLRAGVIGVGGYTGAELLRLLQAHPRLRLARVAGNSTAGKPLAEVLPHTLGVAGVGELVVESFEPGLARQWAESCDVVFCGLPHGASAAIVAALVRAGLTVVDLSADYRLEDVATYERWYGSHPAPELLAEAVYGLPELHRERLRGARLIAAPGCYPTAALLPLTPLLGERLIEAAGIVIDAKSGVSGAGRSPSPSTHYPEAAEGLRPYKVAGSHRHTPEIEQELARAHGGPVTVSFTPHLVPFSRGMLSVAYARATPGTTAAQCREAARARLGEGLVSVLPPGRLPDTLHVRGSARALLAFELDERTQTVLAMCAIDNLTRGASGQGLQAYNVSRGWDEATGLPLLATFP